MTTDLLLQATDLKKSYGAVQALRGVDFSVARGETIALVGDNGAGKSTLVKILSGAIQPTSGSMRFDGKDIAISSTEVARRLGIETVYQDLGLCDNLTVAENIFLGREQIRRVGPFTFLKTAEMRRRAEEVLRDLSVNVPRVTASVAGLSGGQRQAVSLARARLWERSMVLLDEPTAALGVQETKRAMDGVRKIQAEGISVVLITHNMPMVMEMSDRVVVMRRGEKVGDVPTSMLNADAVVSLITGARERWIEPATTPFRSRRAEAGAVL
ncbi:monosaccharide ABC transporter ATP-binding protein, CUT2 family [Faunimonas pinastri]|uniref:Monosaccharide ABC transporter ATP-binding protein, CUT2 family n=1 Tax=Faunimonas pinastri TaxID=1855383 RepID=A0A1H9EJH7_9HYPH|nr:ATP-binding cassette domain-containing protein [Faunimonas pinastri]SEQ25916.1 monosaccharide ABC transporter ATP-binding protein, CUT2 family [Faunimonas pinastri]